MKLTPPLNPGWRPGDKVHSPVQKTISVDPKALDSRGNYKLLIGSILPRPIAFVTTLNENGSVNAAPFSSYNLVGSDPATLVFSVARKPNGAKKDTLVNIEREREFVVNAVGAWMIEAVNHCAAEYPYGVSELAKVGLSSVPSEVIATPRVQESAVQMECRVYSSVDVGVGGVGSSTVVIGEVVRFHIAAEAYKNGAIEVEALEPVSRLGGIRYALVGDMFDIERPVLDAGSSRIS